MEDFWKAYKKKCVEYGCDVSKKLKGDYDAAMEDALDLMKPLRR